MKYFLFSIFLFTNIIFQEIDIESLKKDPIIIQYKKVHKDLQDASISRKYKLPNDPNLQKEFAANPTKEGMIKVLKAKGMVNAEEYVDKLFLQTTLMFQFLQKHPEISKLELQKKTEVLGKLLVD